jgi:predicted ATPase
MPTRGWKLRATMSLSRLWQRQGRHDEARAALAATYNTYTEGFTTPDLVDATAILRALARRRLRRYRFRARDATNREKITSVT